MKQVAYYASWFCQEAEFWSLENAEACAGLIFDKGGWDSNESLPEAWAEMIFGNQVPIDLGINSE